MIKCECGMIFTSSAAVVVQQLILECMMKRVDRVPYACNFSAITRARAFCNSKSEKYTMISREFMTWPFEVSLTSFFCLKGKKWR